MADVLAEYVKSPQLELNSLSTADRRHHTHLHLLARRPLSLLLLGQSMSMPDQHQQQRHSQPRPSPPLPTRRCLFGRSDPIQDAADRLRIREQLSRSDVERWNFHFGRDLPCPGRYAWVRTSANNLHRHESSAAPRSEATLQSPRVERSDTDAVAVSAAAVPDNIVADALRSGTVVDVQTRVERRMVGVGFSCDDVTATAAGRLHDQSTSPVSHDVTASVADLLRHSTPPVEVNRVSRRSTSIKKKRRQSGHLTTMHSAGAARLTAFYPIKKSVQVKRCDETKID